MMLAVSEKGFEIPSLGEIVMTATLKTGRVGCGKSIEELKILDKKHHLIIGEEDTCSVFASLTKVLSSQSYEYFTQQLGNANARLIDGAGAVEMATIAINSGYKGVLFITHKAMSLLSETTLSKVNLIIDELPTADLVKKVELFYEDNPLTNPVFLQEWIEYSPTEDQGYKSATLKPEFKEDAIRQERNIREGVDKVYSKTVADILQFLIREEDVLYKLLVSAEETGKSKKAIHNYKAYDTGSLKRIMESPKSIVFLTANSQDNVLTYTATAMGYHFNVETILEQKHKHKVIIYPLMSSGRWSGNLRDNTAVSNFVLSNTAYENFNGTGAELIQTFAMDRLGAEDLLLFKNKDTDVLPELMNETNFISTNYVHGLNAYSAYTKAAYIASTRLNGWEDRVLKLFAKDKGLDATLMSEKFLIENNHEACYQCLGRTYIRTSYVEDGETSVFIVPDMEYAQYVQSKFEEGCCVIDTSYSLLSASAKKKEEKKVERKEERYQAVINVLLEKRNNKGKKKADRVDINSILEANKLSSASFSRYKKEFRENLKKDGYL